MRRLGTRTSAGLQYLSGDTRKVATSQQRASKQQLAPPFHFGAVQTFLFFSFSVFCGWIIPCLGKGRRVKGSFLAEAEKKQSEGRAEIKGVITKVVPLYRTVSFPGSESCQRRRLLPQSKDCLFFFVVFGYTQQPPSSHQLLPGLGIVDCLLFSWFCVAHVRLM